LFQVSIIRLRLFFSLTFGGWGKTSSVFCEGQRPLERDKKWGNFCFFSFGKRKYAVAHLLRVFFD
jgi:hypothetical protein